MVLIAVDIFGIDKERGTMKFAMLSGIKPIEIYAGKLLTALATALSITLINFTVSLTAGLITIGGNLFPRDLLDVFLIYISASIPGMAVVTIISVLSLFSINSKVMMGGGIMIVFILGMADSLTAVGKELSPIGVLSVFGNDIPFINAGFISSLLLSLVYTVVFTLILMTTVRKIDYFD
jgi:ABC-type transport system involved in multi-copper enzyme maturation permease subunit